jgi:hypothetical protein
MNWRHPVETTLLRSFAVYRSRGMIAEDIGEIKRKGGETKRGFFFVDRKMCGKDRKVDYVEVRGENCWRDVLE